MLRNFPTVRYSILLLLYAFCLLICCSNHSWLRMDYPHVDTSWFFMGGKAWFNGMSPYVDFTDSKGPLLWLIYGLGFLLSPNSFHGVFWMEILFYWGTFYFLFNTALILFKSPQKALLSVFLASLFYFVPGVHNEVRAEDFCQLFFAIVFYSLVSTTLQSRLTFSSAFLTGLSIGASLMIKFNIAAVLAVPAVFTLVAALRYGPSLYTRFIGFMAAGFLTVVVPFIIFFLCSGSLNAFIQEYFINTLSTVGGVYGTPGQSPNRHSLGILSLLLSKGWFGVFFKISIILVAWLPIRVYKSNFLRTAIWVSFIFTAVMSTSIVHEYYLNCLAIFCVFGVFTACYYIKKPSLSGTLVAGAVVIALIAVSGSFFHRGEFYDVKNARYIQATNNRISRLMQAYAKRTGKTPTISYVGLMDRGEHISSGALPGTKYWAHQNGSNLEMHNRNRDDVFVNLPDFVVVRTDSVQYRRRIEQAGYTHLMDYSYQWDVRPMSSLYVLTPESQKRQ